MDLLPSCPLNPDQLPGDALYLDLTGVTGRKLTASGDGRGMWTFTNRQPVVFTGFEKMDHVGIKATAPEPGMEPRIIATDVAHGATFLYRRALH
jgi:hypothetical protein